MSEIKQNIIDIDLSFTSKKCIRFDNDDNRVVYINTSDMTLFSRLSKVYPKLIECANQVATVTKGIDTTAEDNIIEDIGLIGDRLITIDKNMRDLIDEIFDAPVSKAAAPDGSMYDLFDGKFRFEYIITAMIGQYDNDLTAEFSKLKKQFNKNVSKYGKEL